MQDTNDPNENTPPAPAALPADHKDTIQTDSGEGTNTLAQQMATVNAASESADGVAPVAPEIHPIAQQRMVPDEPKNRKGMMIGLIAGAVLLVIALFGAGYYFMVVRVQNGDYLNTTSAIDTMITDVAKITDDTKDWQLIHPTGSFSITANATNDLSQSSSITDKAKDNMTDAKKHIDEYAQLLKQIQSSPALTKDLVVQKAYTDGSKVIDGYKSFDDIITTQITMGKLMTCDGGATNATDYNGVIKSCNAFMTKNPTVPLKEFNDKYYVPLLAGLKDYLGLYQNYQDTLTKAKGDAKVLQDAQVKFYNDGKKSAAAIQDIYAEIQKYTVAAPMDPTTPLQDLKKAVQSRESILVR